MIRSPTTSDAQKIAVKAAENAFDRETLRAVVVAYGQSQWYVITASVFRTFGRCYRLKNGTANGTDDQTLSDYRLRLIFTLLLASALLLFFSLSASMSLSPRGYVYIGLPSLVAAFQHRRGVARAARF